MRRKSERNKAKPAEKKPEPSPKKSRRSSRRRKRSTSRSSSDDSDDAPLKSAPEVVVVAEVPPKEEPKKSSSHSNSEEDKDEQPIWKVKTSDVSSGEIQKLKICLQRPSTTPERTEKSPRRRRGKTSSQSDEASLTPDEKIHKRKSRNSPSVNTSEGSSLDNSAIEAAERDESLIIIKETNEVIIGKGKLDSSQTKQDSENEKYVQDSQIEENEKESHNKTNKSNDDNDQSSVEKQTNEQSSKKQTDEEVQYSKVNKIEDEEIINKETEIPQSETSAKDIEKEVEPETIKNESKSVEKENKAAVSEETNLSAEIKETTVEDTSVQDKSIIEKSELPENNEKPADKIKTSNEPESLIEIPEKVASPKDEDKPVNQLKVSPEVQKDENEKVNETCTKMEEIKEVENTKEVQEINEEVKDVKEELKEINEEVKEINEEVKDKNEEVKEVNKEVKESNEEINRDVKEINKEVKEINEEINRDVKQINKEVKEINEEVKEINEEVKDITEEVKDINEEVKDINEEVKEINEEVAETKEDIKEINEKEIAAKIEETSESLKESEEKREVLVKEDLMETEDLSEKNQKSVEKTNETTENDIATKSDTSESIKNINKTIENKEEPVERPVRKRKWGKYKVSLRNEERITLNSIASFCPLLKMLNVDELKLERHEPKEYEPKLPKRDRKEKDTVQMPSSPKNDDDTEKDVSNIGLNRKISIVNDEASKLQPPPSPANHPVSSILYITNLVRPFTLKQLQELLSRTGKIIENGFWTDKIKSKCYVEYETEEEAENTRNALHGVQWPTGNGKKLIIDFATQETMKAARNVNIEIPVVVKATPDETPEKVAENAKKEIVSNDQRWDNQRTTAPIREWDLGKVPQDFRDRSRSKERDNRSERAEKRRPSKNDSPSNGDQLTSRKKRKDEQAEVKLMDDLFHKTKATPSIYWLPLSPDQIAKKQQQRLQRMAEHKRRMEESRRFDRDRDFGRGGGQRARRRSARHDGD